MVIKIHYNKQKDIEKQIAIKQSVIVEAEEFIEKVSDSLRSEHAYRRQAAVQFIEIYTSWEGETDLDRVIAKKMRRWVQQMPDAQWLAITKLEPDLLMYCEYLRCNK